jgi:hypothetical protein
MTKRTFVVGDVHGHHDRLLKLLYKAGAIDVYGALMPGVEIVQLGDLGNFTRDTYSADVDTLALAHRLHIQMLWGNHDRAVVDPMHHRFRNFHPPGDAVYDRLLSLHPKLALARHGYLLTHAGLNPIWARSWPAGMTADEACARIYEENGMYGQGAGGLTNQIGKYRGGSMSDGGILWRDDDEPLWMGVPQIYGHSRGDIRGRVQRLEFDETGGEVPVWSLCIDVGGHSDGNLAGVWLDTMKVVAVGPDATEFETTINEVGTK